eukprot:GEMP01050006.1.p1 GENE.GEMP01050006.1~~GEMP01050006.1.p1  ORF type:complete len:344 (-),score=49.60 GEMP01050006.1:380-1411(-)
MFLRNCFVAIICAIYQIPRCLCSMFGAIFVCCGCVRCCGFRLRSSACVKRFLYWSGVDSQADLRLSCLVHSVNEHPKLFHRKLSIVVRSGGDHALSGAYCHRTRVATNLHFNYAINNMTVEQGYDMIDVMLCDNKTILGKGQVKVTDAIKASSEKNASISVHLKGMDFNSKVQITWMSDLSENVPLMLGAGLDLRSHKGEFKIEEIAKLCAGPLNKVSNLFGMSNERYFKVTIFIGEWVLAWYNLDKGDDYQGPPIHGKYVNVATIKEVFADFSRPNLFIIRYYSENQKALDELILERKDGPTIEAWVEGLDMIMSKLKDDKKGASSRKSAKTKTSESPANLV